MVKNPPANAGDTRDAGSIPGLGRSPGGRHRNPLQCSCLENPVDRRVWRATVHGVAKTQTRLSDQIAQHIILPVRPARIDFSPFAFRSSGANAFALESSLSTHLCWIHKKRMNEPLKL